jgi:hypothetical protein
MRSHELLPRSVNFTYPKLELVQHAFCKFRLNEVAICGWP